MEKHGLFMNIAALELRFRESEWLNAWAYTRGAENRQTELDHAWRLLTQTEAASPEQKAANYLQAEAISKEITADALAFLTDQIRVEHTAADHDAGSVALLALNPLGWERTDVIQIGGDPLELIDPELLNLSPINQTIVDEQGRSARLYEVHAPACGYRAYRTRKGLPGRLIENPLQAEKRRLESEELRITFDEHAEIDSLYDKIARRELVLSGATINQWILGKSDAATLINNIVDWQVTESGPLRATVKIVRSFGESQLVQQISLWRHSRRVDFRTTIDWHDEKAQLQALFPLNLHPTAAANDWELNTVDRPVRWVDVSENDYGVALMNNGYGAYDIQDNVISIKLIEADQQDLDFTYCLFPHIGNWEQAQIPHRTYEFTVPLHVVRFRPSDSSDVESTLPPVYSFVSVDNPLNIIYGKEWKQSHE